MTRSIAVVVIATLTALVVLVLAGRRVLARDREALYERYAVSRTQDIDEAAHELGAELADLSEDLDLAATLVQSADSSHAADRELHAIATIKREYASIDARTPSAAPVHIVAFDTPAGIPELTAHALAATLDAAEAAPGTMVVSSVLRRPGDASWYRVYARRAAQQPVTIGVVVDLRIVLARVELPRDALSRVLILGPDDAATPNSDRRLATLVDEHPFDHTAMLPVATAVALGLPASPAVGVSVAIDVPHAKPWRLYVVSSANRLDEQARLLVRRVLVGCALVLVLLLSAAAYVIRNTRRAAMIDERLRNALRLEHLTERAEKTVDHIPSGVLMLSSEHRITGANRWFRQRICRELAGARIEDVLAEGAPEDATAVRSLLDDAQRMKQPQSMHRSSFLLFGQETWLNIHAIPLERATDDASLLLVFEDLTQVRRVEARLLRSEKLVTAGQLAAGIAHEVGTPLNVARGRIELAMSHLGGDHVEAGNHRVAIDQIDRVTRLIQQLLDYVRPTPDAMQPLDVAAALATVRDLLVTQATKRGVSLELLPTGSLPTIRANHDQVQQVLVNLVLNALDACERKGHVEISATRRGDHVVMEVRDDGVGIAREVQAQIFDPFFTTKKRGQGTGLGLWVVAQIVRAHGGEVELESAPQMGTRVRIAWPVMS